MPENENSEPNGSDNEKKKGNAAQGCLVLVFLIVGAVLLFNWLGGNGSDGSNSPREEVVVLPGGRELDDIDARILCENQIKDQLKAPSTADFPGPFSSDYSSPTKVGNTWRWTVPVDAQNSFGAMIRTEFRCVIDGDENTVQATPI